MISLTLEEVAQATGGRLVDGADPCARVTGPVVIDSRRSAPGALFVCIVGERFDGHAFADAAARAGAVAVVAARPVGVPAVVVKDPATALAAIASTVLAAASRCRVVGVTGSSGKTSTKDLLAQVLERAGETVSPEGSFNNELGLPLTVLRVTESTRHLVCEYSARGVGHIRYLCGIARPSLAVVLNVGDAHLGEFGSRAAIAQAKGELVEALPDDGTAVLNADDPLVAAMAGRTRARVVTFGSNPNADVRLRDVRLDPQARPRFTIASSQGEASVALQLHGVHQASNAAAVTAAALSEGMSLSDIVEGLESAVARSAHRMHLQERSDGLLVVDDSYNANPDSVRAALGALVELGRSRGGRTWAVLGEMRELGDESDALHRGVGRDAARLAVDEVVAVGGGSEIAAGTAEVAGWNGTARVVDDADAAVALLRAEVRPVDVVLVKASNSLRLWRVADALLADLPAGATA